MKLVIISGGSGNDALIKGVEKLFVGNEKVDVKVIVNAYDNGKSTGVCRAITNTLGVSDIRKNHSRLYKAIYGDHCDKNLLEFYCERYNFPKGKELENVLNLLENWNMSEYKDYAIRFFARPEAKSYEFNDFSVSNIIYSEMYSELGYEKTNKHFCDRMNIPDFVVLNSFDNLFVKAETQSGKIISDEGEIVCWNNPDDKIVKMHYDVKNKSVGLNPYALKLLDEADFIVISTGTFWSSIQPTLDYLDFYKFVNASKAKKVWVMNNEEDGDSFGVTSIDFAKYMEQTGLDLSDFTILLNSDARDSLKMKNDKYNFVIKSMGNTKGKHDGDKYVKALFQIYYGLENANNYDKIIFDFDDTIWARNAKNDIEKTSLENVKMINDYLGDKAVIISGNSFHSIDTKLNKVYGDNLKNFNSSIWADANSTLYKHGKQTDFINEFVIDDKCKKFVEELKNKYALNIEGVGVKVVNYKIKPLTQLERKLLVDLAKEKYADAINCKITGKTTVDILSPNNNKSVVFKHCNYDNLNTLFIGDEINEGNDESISKLCTKSIEVNDINETNTLLKLLIGD